MVKISDIVTKLRQILRGIPIIPLILIIMLFVAAIFAGFFTDHDPEYGEPRERLTPPAWMEGGTKKYLLGTDTMGRDILTRLIYGTRVSLLVSFSAVFICASIGTIIGVAAGFFGGWIDQLVMRFTDAWLCIPAVMIAILLAVVLGPSVINIVLIMAIIFWTRYARLARGETLSLKSRDFVHLATIAGCGKFKIMRRHILPNVMNTVITMASLQVGIVIVVEAALTFLGVGVPPPKPAWGLMLSEGRSGLLTGHWWLILFPGVAIAILVMSFNLIGDWLRVRLDPHIQDL